METLQQVVAAAVKKCGGSDSELAREIERRFGVKTSPQAIEYLRQTSRSKLAQRSSLTPYILKIAGMDPTWSPQRKRNGKIQPKIPEPLRKARIVTVKIKETGEVKKVELTTEALRLAKAFMDLDVDDRKVVAAKVEALEVKRKALKGEQVPDEKLHHLARPDTDEGRALAAKARKKSMSKHSS